MDDYLADYNPRMKSVMAFDNLEMNEKSGENLEFGDETHQYLHFDSYMPDVLEMPYQPPIYNAAKQPDEGGQYQHRYRLAGPTCLAGDRSRRILGYSLYINNRFVFGAII